LREKSRLLWIMTS